MLILNENIFSFKFVHSRSECDWLHLFLIWICEVWASIETHTKMCENIYWKNVHCKFTQNTQKMLQICMKKIYFYIKNIYFDSKNIWKHKIHKEKKQQEYAKYVEKHEVTFLFRVLCANDVLYENLNYQVNLHLLNWLWDV